MKITINQKKEIKTLKELKKYLKENSDIITEVEIENGGEFQKSLYNLLKKTEKFQYETKYKGKKLRISFKKIAEKKIEDVEITVETKKEIFFINLDGKNDIIEDNSVPETEEIKIFKELYELINIIKPSQIKRYSYGKYNNKWEYISKEIKGKGKITTFFKNNAKLVFQEKREKTFLIGFTKFGNNLLEIPIKNFEIKKYLNVLFETKETYINFQIENKEISYDTKKSFFCTINKNSYKEYEEYEEDKFYINNIYQALNEIKLNIEPNGEKKIQYFINIVKKLKEKIENQKR